MSRNPNSIAKEIAREMRYEGGLKEGNALCPTCQVWIPLTKRGMIKSHKGGKMYYTKCSGSGTLPSEGAK